MSRLNDLPTAEGRHHHVAVKVPAPLYEEWKSQLDNNGLTASERLRSMIADDVEAGRIAREIYQRLPGAA